MLGFARRARDAGLNPTYESFPILLMKYSKREFILIFPGFSRYCLTSKFRFFFFFVLFCLITRSLPYLAPIHARDIAQEQDSIEFRDRDGLPLGTILTRDSQHTAVVPLEQISPHFLHAILAAEDSRFYQHGAIDPIAIGRALSEAIEAKHLVSGASTITMQLARMLENPEGNIAIIKIREIWLSWRLVAGMNKNEILIAYINRLPMGGNIYGVEAASRTYFGIPAKDLTLAQGSILASIPNDPNNLNPYHNFTALKKRQKYVLNRMVREKYITSEQAEKVLKEEILLLPRKQGIIAAPHFLFWLASQLPPNHPTQIRTTIDRALQKFVETQVQQTINNLASHNVHHGAALVINNHTGEILAYIGSPDYFNETNMGRNDGIQALRQPGSTLKPFLYELALEKKVIKPNSILADVPTYYAIPGAKLYNPTNYNEENFLGPVRVRIALANSLNIPAVKVLEKVGVDHFLTRLRNLGFSHLTQSAEYYGLGLTLGSGEVSLWELANAYRILANQGKVAHLVTILNENCEAKSTDINQKKGEKFCVKRSSSVMAENQIDAPTTWALITDILSDAHARAQEFGVNSVLVLPFPTAVKTGTSSDFRDTWTIGFSSDYTVATWVGNFNGDRMNKVSGVMGAAPLWNRIMLHLHQEKEPDKFREPKGLVKRPICAISGLRPTPDCPSVVQEYLDPNDLSNYEKSTASLSLPSEYKEWLSRQNQVNLTSQELQIVFPQNDDYFVINNQDKNQIELKVSGVNNRQIEWFINGEKLGKTSLNTLFWQMKPGEWTLEVKAGKMTDKVKFQVEIADNKPKKRGFSLTGTSH